MSRARHCVLAGDIGTLSAICLPHIAMLARLLPPDHATRLPNRQADLLTRFADDMRRFALKQDAAKRFLASAEEIPAGQRGLRLLLGHPDVAWTQS